MMKRRCCRPENQRARKFPRKRRARITSHVIACSLSECYVCFVYVWLLRDLSVIFSANGANAAA